MRAKVRKGRSIEKEKKMATNKVADYIVITDAPSQIGGLGGQWRFKVPLNIDLNSYAVLYFVLREMDADDVTLNVKINGKPISTPPYLTFNGDDHPFRSMHEVFKLKDVNISLDQDSSPPANQLEFSMNAQDHDYITVSDIVLWFQVDSGKMDAILLDGVHGDIIAGARSDDSGKVTSGEGQDGDLVLNDGKGHERIHLDAGAANLSMGGHGEDGDILLNSYEGEGYQRIHLDAGGANMWIGGNDADGDIMVFPNGVGGSSYRKGDDRADPDMASFHLDGDKARLTIGGGIHPSQHPIKEAIPDPDSKSGEIYLRAAIEEQESEGHSGWLFKSVNRIVMLADDPGIGMGGLPSGAHIHVGGFGAPGRLYLYPSSALNHTTSTSKIRLDGETGEITAVLFTPNPDCAEDFEVEEAEAVEPGTVLVIGEDAKLHVSHRAYDKRVAGVVSGAGDYRPGIILGRRAGQQTNRLPVALVGRVFCKVDADQGAIEIGDLLTSSSEPGYAMKASDPVQAFGAVLGKALSSLGSGRGLIPVMVALH